MPKRVPKKAKLQKYIREIGENDMRTAWEKKHVKTQQTPGVILMRARPNIFGVSSLQQAGPVHEPEDRPVRLRCLLHWAIDVHQVGHNGHLAEPEKYDFVSWDDYYWLFPIYGK